MTERRFTDKEVALILRRASELEERTESRGPSHGRGLTLPDLREIAAEAGIDPDLVSRAAAEMEGAKGLRTGSILAGPGTVRRDVRAIPVELSRERLAELVRVIDEEVVNQGTLQEALGQIRWTSQGRILSTQVSLEPGKAETLIRVEERYSDAVRGMLHGMAAGYAFIFGLAGALEGLDLALLPGISLALASAAAGWGLGGAIWRQVSSKSRARVRRLGERLGLRARELLESEMSGPGTPSAAPSGRAPEAIEE
jgi:DNA-binding transcriptional regulator YhcF (GntR family)